MFVERVTVQRAAGQGGYGLPAFAVGADGGLVGVAGIGLGKAQRGDKLIPQPGFDAAHQFQPAPAHFHPNVQGHGLVAVVERKGALFHFGFQGHIVAERRGGVAGRLVFGELGGFDMHFGGDG